MLAERGPRPIGRRPGRVAGIAIVPHGTITQEVAKQTLVEIRIEDQEFFRPLAAIHKKSKVLSPAMKQFLAVLKSPG